MNSRLRGNDEGWECRLRGITKTGRAVCTEQEIMNSLWNRRTTGLAGIAVLIIAAAGLRWMAGRTEVASLPPAVAPVPVVVTQVEQRDVPHLTRGIGTVQSLHSVTIRSQVDGVLTEVLFQEGQLVNKGDLLARIDDRAIAAALEQARAERNRNEAQLDAGQIDLERYEQLLRDKTISTQTVDQQVALVRQWKAAIAASNAAIAAAEVQLSYTRVTSPVSGRTGIRRIDPGNLIRTTDTEGLVSVTQMDPIAVVFSLPQDLMPRIQQILNDPSPAPVSILDRDEGVVLAQGRLVLMDNQIDPRTGTIQLKAEFPNLEGRLWPGQFVTVQLHTGLSRRALVVDAPAVQRGREHPFVYRVAGGRVEAMPVTVDYENDEIAVIGGGLALGDIVVSDGQSRLKPGVSVKIVGNSSARAGGGERSADDP